MYFKQRRLIMKIYSVFDKEFAKYGVVVNEDFAQLVEQLKKTPLSESVTYVPSIIELEQLEIKSVLEKNYYAGMPIQIGYCNGRNNILNALEYHKGNEINVSDVDIILMLGDVRDIKSGKYNTANVEAFCLPAGVAVEMFATTLHYAPCGKDNCLYRTAIILPKGTNYEKPAYANDKMIWGSNKWLLAHKYSPEAKSGAYVGLTGENLSL